MLASVLRWCACVSGAPFKGSATWLHNKPWLLDLTSSCSCAAPHFKLQGTLGPSSLKAFFSRCSFEPSLVFAALLVVGTRLSELCCVVPRCFGGRMAAGSLCAASGFLERPPCAVELVSCGGRSLCPGDFRPPHEDPEWIGELADSSPRLPVCRLYPFQLPAECGRPQPLGISMPHDASTFAGKANEAVLQPSTSEVSALRMLQIIRLPTQPTRVGIVV